MLRDMVRNFVQEEVEPQAHEHDRHEKFNADLFRKLGDLGLLGITIGEEYGGVGMDATAVAIVNEELSYSDPGFCLAYLAHAQLMVNNLAYNGDEGQKGRILPLVCSGEWIGCMGMSEPGHGTDVLGMTTSASPLEDGTWLLNGRKMWITNGVIDDGSTPADVCMVYAKTGQDDDGRQQITTFIVERGMEGYSVGQKILDKLGMRASNTAELVFDDVKIPSQNVVGKPGESTIHMMRNLEIERDSPRRHGSRDLQKVPINNEPVCLGEGGLRKADQGVWPDPETHSRVMGRVQGNEGLCVRHRPEHEVVRIRQQA